MNAENTSWKALHHQSTIVDLHTHPSLKATVFHRNLGRKKTKFLTKLFKEKFWPFSGRVTFPKMQEGGVDVLLSTAYILEQGWIDDISLIKWLFKFFSSVLHASLSLSVINTILKPASSNPFAEPPHPE